ncbi:MAG TPA: hypothetical protein VK901_06605 [Nitrospiraceae bacterium]|nr:hypothetical protein [Nitrospiraceae bacterium]
MIERASRHGSCGESVLNEPAEAKEDTYFTPVCGSEEGVLEHIAEDH